MVELGINMGKLKRTTSGYIYTGQHASQPGIFSPKKCVQLKNLILAPTLQKQEISSVKRICVIILLMNKLTVSKIK